MIRVAFVSRDQLFYLTTLLLSVLVAESAYVLADDPTPPTPDEDRTLTSAEIVFSIVGIVVGLLACFFGYRLFYWMLFCAGAVGVGGPGYLLLKSSTSLSTWEMVGIAIGAGVVAGIIFIYLWIIGLLLLGALSGVLIAIFIQTGNDGGVVRSSAGFYALLGGCGVAGAIIIWMFQKLIIIVFTSFCGAFAVGIAIDTLAKGQLGKSFTNIFENDFHSIDLDETGKILLGVSGALCLLGIIIQFSITGRTYNHRKEEEEEAKNEKKALLSTHSNASNKSASNTSAPKYVPSSYSTAVNGLERGDPQRIGSEPWYNRSTGPIPDAQRTVPPLSNSRIDPSNRDFRI